MTVKFYDKDWNWLFSYHDIKEITGVSTSFLHLTHITNYKIGVPDSEYEYYKVVEGECED